ncbi:MAG: chitobiase/beta-hexosaminidase C-terminal domain-containing protein [Leptospirales bacterium]
MTKKTVSKIGLIILVSYFTINCSGNVEVTVSAEDGGVVNSSSGATLSIPPGAMDVSTTIVMTSTDKLATQDNVTPIDNTYNFSPDGHEFNLPATLEICYDPQEITSQGLSENTVSVYYLDPNNGAYANVGGEVDAVTHCVTASVGHFSTYLIAARNLAAINTGPVVDNPVFMPSTVLAGLPLAVRSIITSLQNGATTGSIASAYLYYRVSGSGAAYTKILLNPEYENTAGQYYLAFIPATSVTTAGIDYYIDATDNLGNVTSTTPSNIPTGLIKQVDFTVPLQFNPAVLDISAGYSRMFTVKATQTNGKIHTIYPSNFTVAGGTVKIVSTGTSANLQFTAETLGPATLTVTSGALTGSPTINVHPGNLASIAFLDQVTSMPINAAVDVSSGGSFDFDLVGYDNYNNYINVLPVFSITNAIGTVDTSIPGVNARFTASNVTTPISGQIDADLGGLNNAISINIIPIVDTPVFTPPGGAYSSVQNVTITSTTGATICYDTAGVTPTCDVAKTGCAAGTLYTAPLSVSTDTDIKAIGCKAGFADSSVSATESYTFEYISFNVTGLQGTLVLQNNGSNDLSISSDGLHSFTLPVSNYDVTVLTHPATPSQTCSVVNGNGTFNVGDTVSIWINCVTNTYAAGGSLKVGDMPLDFTLPLYNGFGATYEFSQAAYPNKVTLLSFVDIDVFNIDPNNSWAWLSHIQNIRSVLGTSVDYIAVIFNSQGSVTDTNITNKLVANPVDITGLTLLRDNTWLSSIAKIYTDGFQTINDPSFTGGVIADTWTYIISEDYYITDKWHKNTTANNEPISFNKFYADAPYDAVPFNSADFANAEAYLKKRLTNLLAPPTILSANPVGGATVNGLTRVEIVFSKPVGALLATPYGTTLLDTSPITAISNYIFTGGGVGTLGFSRTNPILYENSGLRSASIDNVGAIENMATFNLTGTLNPGGVDNIINILLGSNITDAAGNPLILNQVIYNAN